MRGSQSEGGFGGTIAAAGSINGDSIPYIVIGASYADPGGRTDAGSMFVVSGISGSIIHLVDGAVAGGQFGIALGIPSPDDGS